MKAGDRIRDLRQSLGLSTHELAQACNMREGFLIEIEDSAIPKVNTLTFRKIADALGTSVDYLLGLEPAATGHEEILDEVPAEYRWLVKWTIRLVVILGTLSLIAAVFITTGWILLRLLEL